MHLANKPSQGLLRGFLGIGIVGLFALSLSSVARGQCATCKAAAGAKQSGMGQGEAKIGVQSTLRVSIKGERATNRERVDALGESLRATTADIKACYAKVVNRDPTRVGALEVVLGFTEAKSKPTVEMRADASFPADMLDCVREVLSKLSLDKKYRPAAVLATLEFSNSRAQGQQVMQTSTALLDTQQVITNAEGKLETKWSVPGGKVTFTTIAEPSESKEKLIRVQQALKKTLGAFLDCRRMAAKGGASPAGETIVTLSWSGKTLNTRFQSSSLLKEQAVSCIKKAFSRLKLEEPSQEGRVTAKVTFGE
jgi:hypothetical protein